MTYYTLFPPSLYFAVVEGQYLFRWYIIFLIKVNNLNKLLLIKLIVLNLKKYL